ncbi:hypothetical protein D3C87_2038980 [compost metagenome]
MVPILTTRPNFCALMPGAVAWMTFSAPRITVENCRSMSSHGISAICARASPLKL